MYIIMKYGEGSIVYGRFRNYNRMLEVINDLGKLFYWVTIS